MDGKLILLIGPSGSGKGVLLDHILQTYPDIISPTSATTRDIRPGEKEGESFYYISRDEFQRKIDEGAFLEWAEFGGNLYGVLKDEVLPRLKEGRILMREVEIKGVQSLQRILPQKNLFVIFIDAGEWEELEQRIKNRAPISSEELARRKEHYGEELAFKDKADFVVKNKPGQLEETKEELERVVEKIRER